MAWATLPSLAIGQIGLIGTRSFLGLSNEMVYLCRDTYLNGQIADQLNVSAQMFFAQFIA
jgi:hypothetical protein